MFDSHCLFIYTLLMSKLIFLLKPIALFVLTILILFLFKRRITRNSDKRKIFFVGPRSSGKTTAIKGILKQKGEDKGIDKTVPTTAKHVAKLNDLEIIEKQQNEGSDDISKFAINGRDKYIFFLRDDDTEYPALAGFDVTFVLWKKTQQKMRKNIIYLEEDASKLIELIYKI